MDNIHISLPDVVLIAGTRVALGVGIGLLLAERLNGQQRRSAGLALLAVGGLTTIPLMAQVLGQKRHSHDSEHRIPHPHRSLYVPEGIGE